MNNPNSARISTPLWWFVEKCTSLTATGFSDEYGGTYTDKPGGHNTRDNLIRQGRDNDYTVRDALNKQGPGDKTAAFDWTFPSAQGGNYGAIVLYAARIKVAWEQKDPRTYALFEVLCEADFDYDPEGYVFYPSHIFRVPDRTHKWHIHFGFIRKYLNDQAAFEAIFSIIAGEALSAWQARTGKGGAVSTPVSGGLNRMFMIQVEGDPTISVSTSMEYRGLSKWDTFLRLRDTVKAPLLVVKTVDDLRDAAGRGWLEDEVAITDVVKANKPELLLDENMRNRIEAAAREAGGSLTADELRAIMGEFKPVIAGAVADELNARLDK